MTGNRDKPVVVLVPGPLHLFWTTGVYYLWELSESYRVVLVVTEDYKDDAMFAKAAQQTGVVEVLYTPFNANIFKKHRFYANHFKKLVAKYSPVFLLQHNHLHAENLYFVHWVRKFGIPCRLIGFQIGAAPLSAGDEYKARIMLSVQYKSKKYKLPIWLARILHYVSVEVRYLLEYYIIPPLFIGTSFRPSFNTRTGKFIRKNMGKDFDLHLCYKRIEISAAEKRIGLTDKLLLIRHPLETVGEECNGFLFQEKEEELVLILPSYGFTSRFTVEMGRSEAEVVEDIAHKWLSVIRVFREKFPHWRIVWKLHPATRYDKVWQTITRQLQRECPEMEVLSPEEQASRWTVKSKIVVSDVSTVLWWASFLKDKLTISLDIFDYPGGADMKDYEGICYFNSVDKLREACSNNFAANTRKKGPTNDIDSLTSFLAKQTGQPQLIDAVFQEKYLHSLEKAG